jgi:G3E family GTPase
LKPLKSSNFRREDRPLTVIAGYLGAGKTTLINRMLADAVAPFAVIVNDLGALAVDQALIAGQQGSTLTLTNGCACCQISADLAAQLERLRQDDFSALVFEASGVAKASRLATLTSQAEGYALAKVVTLVDGLDAPRLLSDAYLSPLIKEQIAAADWVLQTKRSEGVHPSLDRYQAILVSYLHLVRCLRLSRPSISLIKVDALRRALRRRYFNIASFFHGQTLPRACWKLLL